MTEEEVQKEAKTKGITDQFTRSEKPFFHVERGEKAYEILLRIAVGLESMRRGEKEIHGQIMEQWKKFLQKDFNKAKLIENPITALLGDAKRIHSSIIKGCVEPKKESSAKLLAGIKKEHLAAIVTYGDAEQTRAIMHALGKDHPDSAKEIILLYPANLAPVQLKKVRGMLEKMALKNELVTPYELSEATDENLKLAMDMADAIFVLPSATTLPAFNDRLLETWRHRSGEASPAAKIVFLSDRAIGRRDAWSATQNVIFPEEVNENYSARKSRFCALLKMSENAVSNCIYSHRMNKIPDNQILGLPPQEYKQKFGMRKAGFASARGKNGNESLPPRP